MNHKYIVYIIIALILLISIISLIAYYNARNDDIKEEAKRQLYLMSYQYQDYFVTGYEDGWIKRDKISDELYKLITNDINYQMRKHKEIEKKYRQTECNQMKGITND